MIDREKVIKGLELCEIGSGDRCYEADCPYYEQGCTESLKNNILALLKEQDSLIEDARSQGWSDGYHECEREYQENM